MRGSSYKCWYTGSEEEITASHVHLSRNPTAKNAKEAWGETACFAQSSTGLAGMSDSISPSNISNIRTINCSNECVGLECPWVVK